MRGILGRHLNPATVLSVAAIFIALGAGAYAGSKIGSGEIAKNAVKSKHVKKNALKGADINESKLGKVPSAVGADTAAQAALADTAKQVETLIPFYKRAAINETNFDVARLGPFRLFGDCSLSPGGQLAPNLDVSTDENDAAAFAIDYHGSDDDITNTQPDFDVGEILPVDSYQESSPVQIITASTARLLARSGSGYTVHATIAGRAHSANPSEQIGRVFSGYAVRSG